VILKLQRAYDGAVIIVQPARLQGKQDLWTYYADCVVAFEKKMSILRGIYIDDSQMDHDGESVTSLTRCCAALQRRHPFTAVYMLPSQHVWILATATATALCISLRRHSWPA